MGRLRRRARRATTKPPCAGQTRGDRRPATGDRRPATGDRRPATGDRRPATGDNCTPSLRQGCQQLLQRRERLSSTATPGVVADASQRRRDPAGQCSAPAQCGHHGTAPESSIKRLAVRRIHRWKSSHSGLSQTVTWTPWHWKTNIAQLRDGFPCRASGQVPPPSDPKSPPACSTAPSGSPIIIVRSPAMARSCLRSAN